MTLEQAIEILNRVDGYKGHDELHWVVCHQTRDTFTADGYCPDRGGLKLRHLTEFEAIAVAEKYRREKKS